MPRLDTAIPTSIVVTNNTAVPVLLPGGLKIAASASNVTIDLSKFSTRQPFGDPSPSVREQVWDAIVMAGRTTGSRGTGILTLGTTVPASPSPAVDTAATDYTGERMNGVGAGTIYGIGSADSSAHSGNTNYGTPSGKGVGGGVGAGAADNTIRTV